MATMLESLRELRAASMEALQGTPAYREFKVLDDAVVGLGGSSLIDSDAGSMRSVARRIVEAASQKIAETRKVSQGDAAAMALQIGKEPLPIGRLLEAAIERGAEIGGANALNNFRSAVSKDRRFTPVKRNGQHFWWLTDEPLSPSWNEPAGPSLLDQPAGSSVHSSQEGGEANAPATR